MFSGISFTTKPATQIEFQKGFKGLTFTTSKRQNIEAFIGFKGITFKLPFGGAAVKIIHTR